MRGVVAVVVGCAYCLLRSLTGGADILQFSFSRPAVRKARYPPAPRPPKPAVKCFDWFGQLCINVCALSHIWIATLLSFIANQLER